jgi:hypothetical protein
VLARVQEPSRALSQLRPEKTWFVTRGRGFDSRHLHCGTAQAYARAVICFGIYLGVRFVSSSEAPVNPWRQLGLISQEHIGDESRCLISFRVTV